MDALIRRTVESKDPRLANAMDMLEKAFDLEFRLECRPTIIMMVLAASPNSRIVALNSRAILLDSADSLPSYFAQCLVARGAPAEDELVDCARMFTKDAYFTFKETETSLRMKLELRGERP